MQAQVIKRGRNYNWTYTLVSIDKLALLLSIPSSLPTSLQNWQSASCYHWGREHSNNEPAQHLDSEMAVDYGY